MFEVLPNLTLQTETEVEFSGYIKPLKLVAPMEPSDAKKLIVMGWGYYKAKEGRS